jgi:hypothetical protein
MSPIFSLFEKTKAEDAAEHVGFSIGKITGKTVKLFIVIFLACTIGLLFLFFSLGKGFDKGLKQEKKSL